MKSARSRIGPRMYFFGIHRSPSTESNSAKPLPSVRQQPPSFGYDQLGEIQFFERYAYSLGSTVAMEAYLRKEACPSFSSHCASPTTLPLAAFRNSRKTFVKFHCYAGNVSLLTSLLVSFESSLKLFFVSFHRWRSWNYVSSKRAKSVRRRVFRNIASGR